MLRTKANSLGRILVVSDSLGTPIHARGIFNFTYSVVEMMRALGYELSLLVEPPTKGILDEVVVNGALFPEDRGDRFAGLADILKHFDGDRFRFDWNYDNPSLQRLSTEFKDVANFRLAIRDADNCKTQSCLVFDDSAQARYVKTPQCEHLFLFNELLTHKCVYSESFRRAHLGLKPVTIDVSDYDIVYVDTPHYLDFYSRGKSKNIFVVHDFIPFYDTAMGFDWRNLFAKKMRATKLACNHVVFNSETTRNDYFDIYGGDLIDSSVVIYPPNRADIMNRTEVIDRMSPSSYIAGIENNKKEEFERYAVMHESDMASLPLLTAIEPWNGSLPYFCTVLSDEPRKNIAVVVEASTHFVGRANFVVIGQIDGNSYMNHKPERFPNLHFTGFVSDSQKYDLLRATKAFIFPSRMEGFGIPVVEAASFGAPIVCADTPVLREITENRSLYFEPDKVGQLVTHLDWVLQTDTLPEIGNSMSRLVRMKYSQEAMMHRLKEVLS